jgi:hypothetical protein
MKNMLRRMNMKRLIVIVASVLFILVMEVGAFAGTDGTIVNSTNTLLTNQTMQGQGYATAGGGSANALGGDATSVSKGGNANSDSSSVAYNEGSTSGAVANISTTSVSNYQTRTPPLTTYLPYLPIWNHGGWGTLKAYFPNGPNKDGEVYERVYNPGNPDDIRELQDVLRSLPYNGPLEALGGIVNGVRTVFGGPDNYHHGRGFQIANSVIRDRRPDGKPLLVFIDSNVDTNLLKEAGYEYVGRISLEGDVDRNWDHVYDAAVAEAIPWDIDILLIAGGMKGITVGSNISFPGAAFGYSQLNYSFSMFGGFAKGTTEGKGKAILSASGYRYWPQAANRRKIPTLLYQKIAAKKTALNGNGTSNGQVPMTAAPAQTKPGIDVSRELYEMAGFESGQRVDHMNIR